MRGHQGKNKFKAGGQWLGWLAALAVVSAGGWLSYVLVLNRPPAPVAVRLLTVKRGTVETTINEGGSVELRNQRSIKSPAEGAVDRVMVKPGDKVKSGQVLLTLRYPERQIALANQQVLIRQEEFNLSRNYQKIIEAQEQLIAEERELKKLRDLALQGAVAQQQVKEQADAARTARSTLRDAQAQVRTSALELRSLQLERQGIQQQLQDTVVTAPLDGVVLGVNVKDGDGVELRTDLLTVGDPRQVVVKLQLSPLNASQVQVNQLARVNSIGPNPQTFTARVESLYPQALTPEENQKQSSSGENQSQSDQPTVPATILLDTPTRKLIPGSRVNVEIVLKKRQNVVVLNTEVVQRSEPTSGPSGKPSAYVWVRNAEQEAQKRPITLGLEGLMNVEVTSGLRAGEQVIVPPVEPPLQPGIPVTGAGG